MQLIKGKNFTDTNNPFGKLRNLYRLLKTKNFSQSKADGSHSQFQFLSLREILNLMLQYTPISHLLYNLLRILLL